MREEHSTNLKFSDITSTPLNKVPDRLNEGIEEQEAISNHIKENKNQAEEVQKNCRKFLLKKALNVLIKQPEVNSNEVSLLGHSEGTIIVPRVAIDMQNIKSSKGNIENIVLVGSLASKFFVMAHCQKVESGLKYINSMLVKNHTGSISPKELSGNNPLIGRFITYYFGSIK